MDEGQKIEKYLQEILSKVDTNIVEQSDEILKTVKFIDDEDNHGFRPLLKLTGQDMQYNSPVWTSGLASEDQTFEKTNFQGGSVIMQDY